MRILFATLALSLLLVACDDGPQSTDQKVTQQQAQLTAEGNKEVGIPGITNFTEMKLVRRLYELRDAGIATFSYVPDMNGKLWHLCDSIGYGLPYGVQFSNPEVPYHTGSVNYGFTVPQAEPNGLFMPPTAEGTWVMCASPKGDPTAVYVEPRVIVSPFKLVAAGEYQVK